MTVDQLMEVLRQNLQAQARRSMSWFQDSLIVFDDIREREVLFEDCVGYDGAINLKELAEAIEEARAAGRNAPTPIEIPRWSRRPDS